MTEHVGGCKKSMSLVLFTIAASLGATPALAAVLFPTYARDTTATFSSGMTGDIAASSFVGADGKFHFVTSAATYEQSDSGGSFVRTFTGDDFGATANGYSTTTLKVSYDTYWNSTASMCYQLDKRSVNPMPSLYEDDHCDVIGVWVDPSTQTWYGVVNDEYQFDPWVTTLSQNSRIATGLHNNRALLASSSDQGVTWAIVNQIVTDPTQPDQTITAALYPNKTYSWGVSGTRFFPDYVTGYAYILYNRQIRNKSGDATVAKWFNLARAPLSGGLAPSTWRKYYQGSWNQPGVGGSDGLIGEPLGLHVTYNATTDFLAYEGTGADGSSVSFVSTPFASGGNFTFTDTSNVTYIAITATNTIVRQDTGAAVSSVSYADAALNRTIAVGPNASGTLTINSTDTYGVLVVFTPTSPKTVFKDSKTNRLYVQPTTINESAFSYNVQSGKYRSVGYDNYVYENTDLGLPNNWVPVGQQPSAMASHDSAYISALDTGSLTNQFVSSRTYSIISDLYNSIDTVTATPHSSSQTSYSVDSVPVDSNGVSISTTTTYNISIGGTPLALQSGTSTWTFEAVMDPYQTAYRSGFYRLKNASSGQYLQVPGTTAAAQRMFGAVTGLGSALPVYNATGNGGFGSPGGSDQWYLLPIGGNTNTVVNTTSSQADITAAQKTSLTNAVGYKIANRNSGLVLAAANGSIATVPNQFSQNTAQIATIKS